MTATPTWSVPPYVRDLQTRSPARPEPPLYGCGVCGRSTGYDTVEVCDLLERVVHADCHEARCQSELCTETVCTIERCDRLDVCDDCGEAVCDRHRPECECP